MFDDIIYDIRYIEILYNGHWKLSRIKDLKPGFLFRYVDNADVVYKAECAPIRNIDDKWGIIGSIIDV